MSEKELFYQKHLDQVSRSFSFCIQELASPYREWIGLSYLICRLLDTVEDALWANPSHQQDSFHQFHQFLSITPSRSDVIRWTEKFPQNITPAEQQLLDDAYIILTDLHELPEEARSAILPSVRHMSSGMSYFVQNFSHNHNLHITSLEQTDQYCFFVAGVVGELLTKLFHIGFKNQQQKFSASQENLKNAIHFGLFLQKINLLKDQRDDELEGRHLISSRQNVLDSLHLHAQKSFEYLISLPTADLGFRISCGWSLFLGLASLPWIEKSWKTKKSFKIPRTQAWFTLNQIKKNINNDKKLTELFSQMSPPAPTAHTPKNSPKNTSLTPWFTEIYQDGSLNPDSLNELSFFSL